MKASVRALVRVSGLEARGHCSRWAVARSEEHTSELQSRQYLVCRLLLEKKKNKSFHTSSTLYNTLTTTCISSSPVGYHENSTYFLQTQCKLRFRHTR